MEETFENNTGSDLKAGPSLSHSLEGSDPESFHVELNYGLALPFKFYIDEKYDLTQEHKAQVTSIDAYGSIHRLEVATQSTLGPLGAFENDVLLVLLSMAKEQRDEPYNEKANDGFKVYFTYTEIAQRLGLIPKNWTSRIKKAINKIKSQGIKTKNFSYNANSGDIVMVSPEDPTQLIRTGTVKIGNTSSDFTGYQQVFYAVFDRFVFDNLYGQYRSVIQSNDYLKLKVGPQRRTFIFLNSKKEKFGDSFSFALEELAMVLGLSGSTKRRRQIGEYLKRVEDTLGTISYGIKKKRGAEDWDIWIDFLSLEMIEGPKLDPFFHALIQYYGDSFLELLDIKEVDIKNLRNELLGTYKKMAKLEIFKFQGEELNPVEFAIDIALFQARHHNYNITSLKGLVKRIIESMAENLIELPEKFRYFVVGRVEEAKKEVQENKMREERERRENEERNRQELLQKSFDDVYTSLSKNNPSYINILKTKAEAMFREAEKNQNIIPELKNTFILSEMKRIAQEEWQSGEFMNYEFEEAKIKKGKINLLN
jgi:hypothetical protein